MNWKQSKIEEILKNYLLINSNSDTFYNCYYKCANKNQVYELYKQKNHEIIFGRRGTGKTTLFKALYYYTNFGIANDASIKCVYIDMEDVVPDDNEINSDDQKVVIIETYRKFLVEFINQLLEFWVNLNSVNNYYDISYTQEEIDLIGIKLEVLFDLIVYGKKTTSNNTEVEKSSEISEKSKESSLSANISFNTSQKLLSTISKFSFSKNKKNIKEISIQREFVYTLDIYSIRKALDELISAFKLDRLIICIDEFTRVDKGTKETIQPYIAQLIKDTLFRNPNISVKVSSLWNKTQIQKRQLNGERIGIELGEDIKRGIELDTMFFGNEHSCLFFKNMIMNTCLLCENHNPLNNNNSINESDFKQYLIDSLFSDDKTFKLMVCGSQGVPRIFGNLLISAINKRLDNRKHKIDAQIVYDCVIENYNRDVRRKLPYSEKIVCAFEDFVTDNKSRFILVSIGDYEKHKKEIDGMINNNYMHQYPSESMHRRLRNRYKLYLVHLGNYLEALGIKDWRKNISEYTALYPEIPKEFLSDPQKYQLILS